MKFIQHSLVRTLYFPFIEVYPFNLNMYYLSHYVLYSVSLNTDPRFTHPTRLLVIPESFLFLTERPSEVPSKYFPS